MHIVFVHVPMSTVRIDSRQKFWQYFDIRYHGTHPGLRPLENSIFELPHWMCWLGGVLESEGYQSMEVMNLESSETFQTRCHEGLSDIDENYLTTVIKNYPGTVFLYSPMTPNLHIALKIAQLVKTIHPNAINIFGGLVATPLSQKLVHNPDIDYIVSGRGESALPELLKALRSNASLLNIGNLVYTRNDNEVITSSFCYPQISPNVLPFPKLDLFPPSIGSSLRYLRIVHALGCPYSCAYCTIQTRGQKPRCFSVDRVISEIEGYRKRFGVHHNIYFGDETFGLDKGPTVELLNRLFQVGNISFDCQTRLDIIDNSMIKLLKNAGCRWVEVGVETLSQKSHNLFKQGLDLRRLEDTLEMVRDEGLSVCSFMINGLPNQTTDEMKRSLESVCRLIERGLLHASYLFGLVPYPGSKMYEEPGKYKMTINHHDFHNYHEDLLPVYSTAHSTPEEMYKVFLQGVEMLSQAMAGKPHLGYVYDKADISKLGMFWESAHV